MIKSVFYNCNWRQEVYLALVAIFKKFFRLRRSCFTNYTNFFLTERDFLPDHQFYHKWALLTDPDDITGGAKVTFDLT